MTIGESIRKARKAKGLTQQRLAKKSGVSATSICSWETDLFYPSILSLISVADVLEISLDELVGRKMENGCKQ